MHPTLPSFITAGRRCLLGGDKTPSLLFLALVTALNLLLTGYRIAVDDQLLYLALIPRYLDPSLVHPNDIYLSLFVSRTYTTLFLILTPLIRLLGWEGPIFTLYALVKFFTYWGVWSLAFGLTRDRRAAALAVLFLLMNVFMKELSVQFYSFTLICRYAVIPFLFFGLRRLWDKRYLAAAVLFGLAFQIHAMSTLYWLVIVALMMLVNLRDILGRDPEPGPGANAQGSRDPDAGHHLLKALGVFLVLALPIVLWSARTPHPPMPADFNRYDWFTYSYVWKGEYIFFSLWSERHVWLFLLCLLLAIVPLRQMARDRALRWYVPMVLGALLVMGLHYVATEIHPFQPLYQLQWYRASDLLPLFATIGMARVLSAEAARPWRWVPALAAAAFLTAITAEAGCYLFSAAALLLAGAMTLEKRRRGLSGSIALLLVVPAAAWVFVRGIPGANAAGAWSAPVFWGIAAVLFTALFYLGPMPRVGDEPGRPGSFRRLLAQGACGLSLVLLALLVFCAPEWRSRGWYSRSPSPFERLRLAWENLDLPGRGCLETEAIRLQRWMRDHTAPGAMVIVPPMMNGFRVFSERSVFVEYFDGEVGVFSAVLAREWQIRMSRLGYEPSHRGLGKLAATYRKMTPEQWLALGQEYGADYLVTDRRAKLPFRQLHQEGRYALWRIPRETAGAPPR